MKQINVPIPSQTGSRNLAAGTVDRHATTGSR